jgi:YfiH family protein
MDVAPSLLVRVHQQHGSRTLLARGAAPPAPPDADIVVTDDPALAVAVQSADCVPLLMACERTGAVAAAHAGWRGLAARVPEATVRSLSREFGTRPEDLVVAIGPAIGGCCYEVGGEVRSRFSACGFGSGDLDRWFTGDLQRDAANPPMTALSPVRRAGHWFFSPAAAARDALIERAHVPASRIHVAELCTASHPDAFCSYRRDGNGAGRMAAAIRSARPHP